MTEFRRDPLAAEHADRRYYGLNLAVAWPWPRELEGKYRDLERRVAELDPGLYVYPFSTTHITLLTAVNFKEHPEPNEADAREIDCAADELGRFVAASTSDLSSFSLETGRPVLAATAAFVPLSNPTGEIALVRERAIAFCRGAGGVLARASAPQTVHSTVMRFRQAPRDAIAFAKGFEDLARDVDFGTFAIDRLLVTLETKPYMRAGRVVRSVELNPRTPTPS